MTILGFTGSRNFTVEDLSILPDNALEAFGSFDGFVTGACIGFDSLIAQALVETYPAKMHKVIVPGNLSRVDRWWEREGWPQVEVHFMPHETSYKDRNLAIVAESSALFYLADYPETDPRSQRSGTWQTVRMARHIDRPVVGYTLH